MLPIVFPLVVNRSYVFRDVDEKVAEENQRFANHQTYSVSITYDRLRAQGTRCKHPSTHDQKDF